MEPKPSVAPMTTDQQIAQILLKAKDEERGASSGTLAYQLYAALGISFLFLLITWHKSGFSWAATNVILSDFYILTLAIGSPWHWLFHHTDPDFKVTDLSRVVSWILLIGSLILGLVLTPSTFGSSLQGLGGGDASLQQAQQLQQELGAQ